MGRTKKYDVEKILDLYINTDTPMDEIASQMGMSQSRLSAYIYGTADIKPITTYRRAPNRVGVSTEESKNHIKIIHTLKSRLKYNTKLYNETKLIDVKRKLYIKIEKMNKTLELLEANRPERPPRKKSA